MRYAILLLTLGLLTGCANFGNRKIDSPIDAYTAGRLLVTVDLAFKPFLPNEYQKVMDSAFALVSIDYDQPAGSLDSYVRGQLDVIYEGETPEFKAAMYNLYLMAKARVKYRIDVNPNIPQPDIIIQFKAGVRDALEMYSAAPQGADTDLTTLFDQMEAQEVE